MKNLLYSAILCLSFLQAYPQSKIPQIERNKKIIGRNYLTNRDIPGEEYVFNDRIYHLFIDTTSNLATIQLRGTTKNGKWMNNTGDLILYDLQNSRIKWSKPISYFTGGIEQHGNLIIENSANKSYSLNIENGKELWKVKNNIFYVDPVLNIGLGYRNTMYYDHPNRVEGIDLKTGDVLWKREICRDFGWNDIFYQNDSVIVVVAAGLHSINLKNGKGWDYDATTGIFDDIQELVSNVLADSLSIYIASKDKISRITHDGQVKWTTSLPRPDELTSQSSIFIKDSILYMVNKGYAFRGLRQKIYGIPYFASFDPKSGKLNFLKTLSRKANAINHFVYDNDTIVFVFKDKVSSYSMIDAKLLTEKTIDTSSSGDLKYFLGSQYYVRKDSVYQNLILSDTTKQYLLTKSNKIHIVNLKLEITGSTDMDQIYLYFRRINNYRFLSKGGETIIIDNTGKEVARLNISGRSVLVGSRLFFITEKSIVEITISEVIKN